MRTAVRAAALTALALFSLASSSTAVAGPAENVLSPIVEEGERELEFKAGTAKLRDGTRVNEEVLAIGWGATRWWFTEFNAIWHKPAGEPHAFDAWEWENRFQLTETGKYPVDIGFVIEIERPRDRSEGYEYTWGPLLQAEFGSQWLGNFNLLVTNHFHSDESSKAELSYQWQLKNRWRPELEFGMQGFGGMGPWNSWLPTSEQSHTAGPVVLGHKHFSGGREGIAYEVGLLFGLNHGAPRNVVRMQLEYEF